jgi:phytoene synthase
MTALTPSPGKQAAADARLCAAHLRRGSKSFALAGLLLPQTYAQDATALYAFCRIADDLIDDSDAPQRAHALLVQRLDALVAASTVGEAAIGALVHPEDRALSRTIARHALPRGPIDALLEGFLWDAEGRVYTHFEDTLAYGARVAGSVGVCMAWLMGQRQPAVLARAADLGVAMQLTNIARDVGEDARRGRVYLPQTWLTAHGISRQALLHAAHHRGSLGLPVRAVVHKLLREADGLYGRGRSGIDALPRGCRLAIDAAARIYQAIGEGVLALRPYGLHKRAVVPLWRKLWLVACGVCRPGGRRHLRGHQLAAPLPAARFLLEPLR